MRGSRGEVSTLGTIERTQLHRFRNLRLDQKKEERKRESLSRDREKREEGGERGHTGSHSDHTVRVVTENVFSIWW